jgi:hypothetical protein
MDDGAALINRQVINGKAARYRVGSDPASVTMCAT